MEPVTRDDIVVLIRLAGLGILLFALVMFAIFIPRSAFSLKPYRGVSESGNLHYVGWLWWRITW